MYWDRFYIFQALSFGSTKEILIPGNILEFGKVYEFSVSVSMNVSNSVPGRQIHTILIESSPLFAQIDGKRAYQKNSL